MKEQPHLGTDQASEETARAERLSRALRANLQRRKEQARARAAPGARDAALPPCSGREPPA